MQKNCKCYIYDRNSRGKMNSVARAPDEHRAHRTRLLVSNLEVA